MSLDLQKVLNPHNKQCLLIIKYGSPGSGKSTVLKNVVEKYGVKFEEFMHLSFDADVDRIIAEQSHEIKAIRNLNKKICKICNKKIQDRMSISTECKDIATSLAQLGKNIYASKRDAGNKVNDRGIANAFRKGQNVIFETTGRSLDGLTWIINLSKAIPLHDYVVILVCPLVNKIELDHRIAKRACISGQIPIDKAMSDAVFKLSMSNLNNIFNKTSLKEHNIDYVIIVDNNDKHLRYIVNKSTVDLQNTDIIKVQYAISKMYSST